MEVLYQNLLTIQPNQMVMWAIGGVLIYLAIAKEMEPTLLLPMGTGILGVFIVTGIIIGVVTLLNKIMS